MSENLLVEDLNYILQHTQSIWPELKNKHIFITGGTGFIGRWLLESMSWANKELDLHLDVVVLTRNVKAFVEKAPLLSRESCFTFLEGDVKNFAFPQQTFDYVIHGATEAKAHLYQEQPRAMLDTILQGTRRTLDFSTHCQVKKFLLLSSGAIYGKQPAEIDALTEEDLSTHDVLNPRSAYGLGKLTSEHMCILHAEQHDIEMKIARCFAFVGPFLPLDKHFAIGNFIRDAISGVPIQVNSDGRSFRSYQYAADLVIWLLHILCYGQHKTPYNVGSDQAISILELAKVVANSINPVLEVAVAQSKILSKHAERYVPSVRRAKDGLGLRSGINLSEAIAKTIRYHQQVYKG